MERSTKYNFLTKTRPHKHGGPSFPKQRNARSYHVTGFCPAYSCLSTPTNESSSWTITAVLYGCAVQAYECLDSMLHNMGDIKHIWSPLSPLLNEDVDRFSTAAGFFFCSWPNCGPPAMFGGKYHLTPHAPSTTFWNESSVLRYHSSTAKPERTGKLKSVSQPWQHTPWSSLLFNSITNAPPALQNNCILKKRVQI